MPKITNDGLTRSGRRMLYALGVPV